ncbi:protein NO VEIN domain-containing protein [Tenacibaculum finnmarkense]|uniref:protein NO VEIN domain-containing protein n=1 Tax=Tenacibaculum finnmarkense TaxID=2781243 RepID=UPI003BB657BA
MKENDKLVKNIFKSHYNFHASVGVDFVKSDAGHISQVSADYQGRVLYELLQNAFDRAENKIIVKVIGNSLFVANDGKKFSYNSKHDYKGGGNKGEKFERHDFQSLCSISTSNKTANKSIGNKGVGFKSVYALGRYANIHTKGSIDASKQNTNVSFRLYDIFDNKNDIPSILDTDYKEQLAETIESIQREFPSRGVPGYYYPIQLENNVKVFDQFNKDIVTIIEVPFKSKEEVNKLVSEIKDIHFSFVGLKYAKTFDIKFETEENTFSKNNNTKDNTLFSTFLKAEKIQELAKKAGITITKPQVAIKFKEEPTGLFYNYLPTRKASPFKYVDFHADFHTTVDRKDINFDGDKIGAYNSALLQACVELYFTVLNSYSDTNCKLNTQYILKPTFKLNTFNWNYIKINNNANIYQTTRRLFKVDDAINKGNKGNNKHYVQFVNLFLSISEKYFKRAYNTEIYNTFFTNIIEFINSFTNNHKKTHSRSDEFKAELFNALKNIDSKILPEISFKETKEIFYRKNGDNALKLPQSISIKITDFEIKDNFTKKVLEIKDFTDSNELLKHFKQCSQKGEINKNSISEEQQQEILQSCYTLYSSKRDNTFLSTHRYTTIFTTNLRDRNSISNQANFSISTLFLKTNNGKYKPAQLCIKTELDLSFLDFINSEDIDNWLRFIGVSTETTYRFVDGNIYNKLKEGVDYLPQILLKEQNNDRITEALLESVCIVNTKNELTHPAIINNNNYSFLKNIQGNKLKPELDNLLVKKYDSFPSKYISLLKNVLERNLLLHQKSILQFYQNIFEVFAKNNWYLIHQNNTLYWVENKDFYILSNKSDFDLCTDKFSSKPILGYYLGKSSIVKDKTITPTKGEIKFLEKTEDIDIKNTILERLPFILINLSHSKNSEVNYLSEETNLSNLQIRFEKTSIYKCASLEQSMDYSPLGHDMSLKAYAYNNNELFLSERATSSQRAQAICDYFFNNLNIKDQVELILFHKNLDNLKKETDSNELDRINRKWKPNYQEKFIAFQKDVLSIYGLKLEGNEAWYTYSKEHRNEFLIKLDENEKLSELESTINKLKNKYEGYFDTFKLEIDYTHINNDIILLTDYYKSARCRNELKTNLEILIKKGQKKVLGIEPQIEKLKGECPEIVKTSTSKEVLSSKIDELHSIQDIEDIYKKIKTENKKQIKQNNLDTSNKNNSEIEINPKQIIFQGGSDSSKNGNNLEVTGASGEVEVLICLINDFIKLDIEDRKKGLEAIKIELHNHTKNNSFDEFAERCLGVVKDDDKLSKALIPLLYVAKKYKYANFDLITYKNNKATLIEVKTTNSIKNKRFFISIAEVNTARRHLNYEIVRVTPQAIIFIGNPIKKIDQNILEIKTTGFTLKPRNYELIIS